CARRARSRCARARARSRSRAHRGLRLRAADTATATCPALPDRKSPSLRECRNPSSRRSRYRPALGRPARPCDPRSHDRTLRPYPAKILAQSRRYRRRLPLRKIRVLARRAPGEGAQSDAFGYSRGQRAPDRPVGACASAATHVTDGTMTYAFDDKHVLITGAGRGLGAHLARHLAQLGASVAVADIDGGNAQKAAESKAQAGGRAVAYEGGVGSRETYLRIAGDFAGKAGRIDA